MVSDSRYSFSLGLEKSGKSQGISYCLKSDNPGLRPCYRACSEWSRTHGTALVLVWKSQEKVREFHIV